MFGGEGKGGGVGEGRRGVGECRGVVCLCVECFMTGVKKLP